MNLKLEKTKLSKFSISNDQDKELYSLEKKFSLFGSTVYIYDENKLQLAELKENIMSKTKYKIYINGSEFDSVSVSQKTPLDKYQLSNKKWTIAGDITYTDYKVLNEKEEEQMTMKCNLVDPNIWDINITTTETTLAIALAMTIFSIAKK